MRNIALIISYDGAGYFGYQTQNGFITIQQVMEETISKMTKEEIIVYGCGRTDTGVHALNYLLTFKTKSTVSTDRIPYALNALLPDDIRVKSAFEADEDFHGRFSVKRKTYVYRILNTEISDPFKAKYTWHYKYPLDIEKMKEAASYIVGEKDFVCFMASGGQVKTTVRNVDELKVEREGEEIVITISSNGFLYNMVRIITGTLVYAGCGKIEPEYVKEIIESKDRRKAGITAPPNGLYLKSVEY
jgi:tRNA pseudouridine38-40 synthase